MSFLRDFFQNLFGEGENGNKHRRFDDHQTPRNAFRKPIWQNNEDDDDEYGDNNRPFPNSNLDARIRLFTNPFEIMRYFESQMENMMKFQLDDGIIITEFNDPNFTQILPPSNQNETYLRDQFLKHDRALSSSNNREDNMNVNIDLDKKISADNTLRVWRDPTTGDSNQLGQRSIVSEPMASSTINFITRPKVQIEQISSFTDSAGNTETTIKRQIDDKIHTIITKRSKDGLETKTENIANVDENDFGQHSQIVTNIGSIFWNGFFDSDPKL